MKNILLNKEEYLKEVEIEVKGGKIVGYFREDNSIELKDNLIFGFDTEYKSPDVYEDVRKYDTEASDSIYPDLNSKRYIVSYQIYTKLSGYKVAIIFYPDEGKQIPFKDFLTSVMAVIKKKIRIKSKISITLVGHFNFVDLSAFSDFRALLKKSQVQTHQRCVFTTRPLVEKVYINRNLTQLNISLRDSMLLGPGKSSLKKLGDALDIPKLEATEEEISNTKSWKEEDEKRFVEYALTDSIIAAEWMENVFKKEGYIPYTTGSLVADKTYKAIKEKNGWSTKEYYENWLGKVEVRDGKRRSYEENDALLSVSNFAIKAMLGGLNTSYSSGIHKNGPYYDYDLKNAYPTAAVILSDIDWSVRPAILTGSLDTNSVRPDEYGCGLVDFEFPEGTYQTCIPVVDTQENRGQIYPLRAKSVYASNPEIFAALQMGAKITPVEYKVLKKKETQTLKGIIKELVEERAKYKKGSAQNLLLKEQVNSIIGKMEQGIKDKRILAMGKKKSEIVEESKITSPLMAGHITSLVRAFIALTINTLVEQGYEVLSVTTDGFISNAPYQVLKEMEIPVFTELFRKARLYLSGLGEIWEKKHEMDYVINMRTRGNIGLNKDGSGKGVFALSNFKVGKEIKELAGEEQRKEMAIKYLERSEENPIEFDFLKMPTIKNMMKNLEIDVIPEERNRRATWEYDFKRRPVDIKIETIEIDGKIYSTPTFFTKSWETFENFKTLRDYTDNNKKFYKSIEDYKDLIFAAECKKERIQTADIQRTKAVQIMRLISKDILYSPYTEEELVETLRDYFKTDITYQTLRDTKRKELQKTIHPKYLYKEISDLRLFIKNDYIDKI